MALYRVAAGRRTYAAVAADVGVTGETLRSGCVRPTSRRAGPAVARPSRTRVRVARLRAELGRLRKAEAEWQLEREILRRAAQYFAKEIRAWTGRWDFISVHRADFGVQRDAGFLVSRSGYYRWTAGASARAERRADDDALVAEIREIHADHRGTYGVRRVHAELRGFGHTVNRKRVERLMRREGIEGRHLHRRKRTTVPDGSRRPRRTWST